MIRSALLVSDLYQQPHKVIRHISHNNKPILIITSVSPFFGVLVIYVWLYMKGFFQVEESFSNESIEWLFREGI